MASIFKRGDKYTARVRLKGKEVTKTFSTKAEAREWAVQTESDINSRRLGLTPKNITVGDLIRRYLLEVTPLKRGHRNEHIRLNLVLKTDLANVLVSELMPTHIAQWRDDRLKKVQSPSVARELTTISSVLNHAMKEWGLIYDNPARKIKRPQGNKARTRRPTDDEINRICLWCHYDGDTPPKLKKQRVALAFLFAIETAMRAGELCGLEWEDIDFNRRVAHLEMTKNGYSRDVPLSKAAIKLLHQLEQVNLPTVFDLDPDSLSTTFRRACRVCGISDLHFHDSRREALTRMSKKVNVMDLAKISGHRDIKILLNTYYAPDAANLADLLD
jgi:integrase